MTVRGRHSSDIAWRVLVRCTQVTAMVISFNHCDHGNSTVNLSYVHVRQFFRAFMPSLYLYMCYLALSFVLSKNRQSRKHLARPPSYLANICTSRHSSVTQMIVHTMILLLLLRPHTTIGQWKLRMPECTVVIRLTRGESAGRPRR